MLLTFLFLFCFTHSFGSLVYSESTGIIYNDEMDDFSVPNVTNFFGLPPSEHNFIAPGRRPMSSACPAIIVDSEGDVRLVIGGAGGTKITSAEALVAARYLLVREDIKTAIDAPRIHHQLHPNKIIYEKDFPIELLDRLSKIGHVTEEVKGRGSVINAIAKDGHRIQAFYDYRKGGSQAGL